MGTAELEQAPTPTAERANEPPGAIAGSEGDTAQEDSRLSAVGSDEAFDEASFRAKYGRRKVVPKQDKATRPLPEPVVNAVYAGHITINGAKGTGTVYHVRRLEKKDFRDADDLAEWMVLDPWGDWHLVVKMSEAGLHRNLTKYRERVEREIQAGDHRAASYFAQSAARIVSDSLIPYNERTGGDPRKRAWSWAP